MRFWFLSFCTDFFALGDVIQSGYDYPTKNVIMVMDRGDKLVAPPVSFT